MRESLTAALAAFVVCGLLSLPARAEPALADTAAEPSATSAEPTGGATANAGTPSSGAPPSAETPAAGAEPPPAQPAVQPAANAEPPAAPAPEAAQAASPNADPDPLDMHTDEQPPASAAATAAPANADSAPPAAEPAAAAPPPAAPPHDPVIAAVREKLDASAGKGQAGDARAALKEFYAGFTDAPIWVSADGFTARGDAVVEEIRKAADWGLSAQAFDLPAEPAPLAAPEVLASAEIQMGLAALKYANHAHGGRVDPPSISPMLDRKPALPDPKAVIRDLAVSQDPAGFLRSQHPQNRQFELLRQALLAARDPGGAKHEEIQVEIPGGPTLKPGSEHPHVALLRQRLKTAPETGKEAVYDDALAAAVKAFQKEKGLKANGLLNRATRDALNGVKKPTRDGEIQRLLVNMERWRWMPESLGDFYVWDNVPEFMTRVVKKGEVVHSAKIVVGKPGNPTPSFTANMLYVIFHPDWGVPDGIKVGELLPYLRNSSGGFFGFGGGADTRILEQQNLRVSYNGRPIDASQIDWSNVDIRRYTFTQPPGPTNVLGVVKFRFPNRHDVYMHDTPQRNLFETPNRAFSHGCMRVQNPIKLAEILLEHDRGLSPAEVARLASSSNQIDLKTPIPVHVVYFTAVAGEDGAVKTYGDVYGHDGRLASALEGRAVAVANDGGAAAEESSDGGLPLSRREARAQRRKPKNVDPVNDILSGIFGN